MEKLPPSCKLALVGQAAGDAFGAPFEYHPRAPEFAELSAREGRYLDNTTEVGVTIHRARVPGIYTDDTQQALALLLTRDLGTGGVESAAFFLEVLSLMGREKIPGAEFGVHRGTGGNFRQAILSRQPVATAGLGAAMRVGPVALTFDDPQEMVEWVLDVSAATTSDPVGLACAAKFAAFVWAVGNYDRRLEVARVDWPTDVVPEEVWETTTRAIRVLKDEGEQALLDFAMATGWANKEMGCAANGFGPTGMAWAIHCALTATSFGDALVRVCSSGGDTDTVGAMAGCLAALRFRQMPDWFVSGMHPEARKNVLSPEKWHPVDSEKSLTEAEVEYRKSLIPPPKKRGKSKRGKRGKQREQIDFFEMAMEAMEEDNG